MGASIKRKNFYLDETKIKRAQRLLGAKTETEAIHKALDLATFQKDILRSLDRTRGKGRGHVVRPW